MSEQPSTGEQHLKRSHDDIVNHEEGKPCDSSIQEPERKKIKANNVDDFVEDTKYWYELISNLDSGPSNYKSFDQLEKGLTDREKVIENINQLWHVHKARLIIESLDLENPYWNESCFELMTNNSLETSAEHDQDPDLVLKDKVTPKELGLSSEISIDILKEYIKKREDIESHGLFLMEKLFKRCHIHSVEEISEMIEKCISIDAKNAQSFYGFLCESDYKNEELAKAWVEKWKKYILPLVVKTQNELNLIDDPVTLETNEESATIKKTLLYQMDEKDNDSFLLEAIDFEDLEVVQYHKSYDKECEATDWYDEEVENIFYCTYLFDLELPDEKEKVGSNFLGLLHCEAENANENVFLKILEMVIKMYIRDTKALDHQEIEVSELRLAVSLMILDCLNKELTYLILSQSKEQTFMLYRPVVRVVLDQFIVDYCHPTNYDKYMFSYCTNPDMQPMINVLFSEEHVDTDNIAWDVTQNQRGIKDWVDSEDYEESHFSFKKHPIWEDTIDNLKDKYFTHQTESHAKISRKNLDESMYITIYTNNENTISEPLSNQNLVSFFRTNLDNDQDVQTYELSADNLIENRSIDCHYTDDKSLHLDLIRLLRRGGVKSFDEGSLIEAYTSLRNYISICLQNLEDIVEDGNVDVEHIEKITKLLANHNDITKKEHVKLQVPYYYKLDYDHYIEPAKSWEEVVEEYLLDTEVQLNGTICADTKECSEGLRKDICSALRDEQLRVLCDSFIQCEDGSRVSVFTPMIKHRLPVLYNQFFDNEEKRKNGLSISSVHFEVLEGENLVFDEAVVTEWLTCIYLGIFEEKKNNLTLQKLLAKWSSDEFESDIKITDQSPQTEKEEEKEENIESDSDFDSEDSSDEDFDEDLESESDTESENEEYEYNDGESPIKRKVIKDQDEEEDSNTLNPLSKLYLDEETKDFSLIVNNHTVKVHKYILGMRSSYFKVLFSGNFSDKNISEYDVSEFLHNLQTVELFTYFLYHDTLDNDNFTEEHYFYQNLVELEEFSQFVLFEKLKLECHSTLISHLSFEKTLEMLKESLETNNEDFFHIAHTLLLKTPYSYFENILDEAVTKYYRIMCISLTLENALLKLDYLNNIEQQETTLHPFILNDAKIQIENLHWFIANRASSLDNKFISALPQPIQDLISRFYTHDNLGMAVFEEQTEPELESTSASI